MDKDLLKKRKKLKKKLSKLNRQKYRNIDGNDDDEKLKNEKKNIINNEEKLLEDIVFNTNASILNRIDRNVDLISIDLDENPTNNVDNKDDNNLPYNLFIVDKHGDDRNIDFDDDDDDGHDKNVTDIVDDGHKQQREESMPVDDDDDDRMAQRFKTELFEKLHGDGGKQNDQSKTKQVWFDDDDEIDVSIALDDCKKLPKSVKSQDKYRQYLERKFTEIYEPPNWAQSKTLENKRKSRQHKDTDDSDDDDDNEIQVEQIAYGNLKRPNQIHQLNKEFLRVKKCPHLNQSSRIRTPLNCLQFHRNSTVALIGSSIGLIRLFQVDGKLNSIIQSIYFQGYRLTDARFISLNGREEILVGSDGMNTKCHGFCYYYDMLVGKILRIPLTKGGKHRYSLRKFQISPNNQFIAACDDNGNINLLSSTTKELISEMKINGNVNCLSFSPDSNYLIAHGDQTGGQAFIFDIRQSNKQCINRFNDLDTISATSMDLSPTGNLLAIGSNMGVINLYQFNDVIKQTNPKPIKSVMNLTTAITSVRFNHDGQLLLFASNQKNDSIRFLNTNSMTVYKNFPLFVGGNSGRTYGRIFDLDFSPHSGYASFVTGHGTGHLFRINEYSNY